MAGKARKVPPILRERRGERYKDRIWERDWSKNPIGSAFKIKAPEPTTKSGFYAEKGAKPSTEEYRMHRLLEAKIGSMLRIRPGRPHAMEFYKGKSGSFYLRLRGLSSDKSVYIKVENQGILKGMEFLFR